MKKQIHGNVWYLNNRSYLYRSFAIIRDNMEFWVDMWDFGCTTLIFVLGTLSFHKSAFRCTLVPLYCQLHELKKYIKVDNGWNHPLLLQSLCICIVWLCPTEQILPHLPYSVNLQDSIDSETTRRNTAGESILDALLLACSG